jgi:hypothetical protein
VMNSLVLYLCGVGIRCRCTGRLSCACLHVAQTAHVTGPLTPRYLNMLATVGNQEARATAAIRLRQPRHVCCVPGSADVSAFHVSLAELVCRFLWRALGQEGSWPAPFVPPPLTLKDPRVMVVLRGLRWMCSVVSVRWLGLRCCV